MKDNKNMTRRDALKTMGAMVATAALATTGLSAFAAPVKNQKKVG
ncbi:MAG: twin-arginine translocation signal domain-containing protein [Prevotella sp.]|nr:twin-arginine translocation signal domain-containing protein [Prevotella sp.]